MKQQMIATVTAAVLAGPWAASAEASSSVRPITRFADLPDVVRADIEPDDGDCHIEEQGLAYGDALEVTGQTGKRLIIVPCGQAGAYNMPFAIYGGYGNHISRTVFPLKFSETTGDTAFNIRYDATERRFTSFAKGRGMGDCGSYYVWRIAEPDNTDFLVLEEVRIKEECDARADGGPATWPLVWKRQ
ncbi:hypothetical protein FHT78_000917 [Rhizobium sp. BK196]|jgi:hypothetical protein|uniref:DUF1176 domain-containing protein n=1 Tax=Rhizobium sp. BK196 TaxID=2587073 RepID=UPI0016078CF2|nr:DUF1176 domain-containing protein [Rhizobium sp. BK196]MBB3309188.1 hypothetical protein [Rhizobium sp. BK196]